MSKTIKIVIAQSIKRLRTEKGITQRELSKALCVSPSAVSNWEACISSIDVDNLAKLSEYFDVPVSNILGEITSLSDDELKIINAYRERVELHDVIKKILDI